DAGEFYEPQANQGPAAGYVHVRSPESDGRNGTKLRRHADVSSIGCASQCFDQAAACGSWVDEIVDAEAFGGLKRADTCPNRVDDLLSTLGRFRRRLVVLAIGN